MTSGESGCPESTACVEPADFVVLVEPPLGVSGLVPAVVKCYGKICFTASICISMLDVVLLVLYLPFG